MEDLSKNTSNEENDSREILQEWNPEERLGGLCIMRLLMREPCKMLDREKMLEVMKKHLGDVEYAREDEELSLDNRAAVGFAAKKYKAKFKEGEVPPLLVVMDCADAGDFEIDEIARHQMWDCENSDEILSECQYEVVATEMLSRTMPYRERADMLMDYMEALVELYPSCEAVHFVTSGKLLPREKIVNHKIPRQSRFIYFTVNVRLFNITGTEDKMADTLGMEVLGLPDLQYHFHGMDENLIVNHAYNMLSYIYDNDCPVKNGDTIDGIKDGKIDWDVRWRCQYEQALIQPIRDVLDVCMGEYASGNRE